MRTHALPESLLCRSALRFSIVGLSIAGLSLLGLCTLAQAADATAGDAPSPAMEYVKDSVITTKIKAQLAEDKMNSLIHISVETDSAGAVSLTGRADTQDDADRAVQIARATTGVTAVNSRITIGSGN